MPSGELKSPELLFKEAQSRLQQFKSKLGELSEDSPLQTKLKELDDLKNKTEASIKSLDESISGINTRLDYLKVAENVSDASRTLLDTMSELTDLDRIQKQVTEALVDVDQAFTKLNDSISELDSLMRENIAQQEKIRRREEQTLDLLDKYLKRWS